MKTIKCGNIFGSWTVVSRCEDYVYKNTYGYTVRRPRYICKCSCKDKTLSAIVIYALTSGRSYQCKKCGFRMRSKRKPGYMKEIFNRAKAFNLLSIDKQEELLNMLKNLGKK